MADWPAAQAATTIPHPQSSPESSQFVQESQTTVAQPAEGEPTTVPAPADSLTLQPLAATLPLDLRLHLDRIVLTPGATAFLTLTVASSQPALGIDLAVSLHLPPGLVTTEGQTGVL